MARLLIAQDDPAIAHLLATICLTVGHTILLARNGREALDLLGAQEVDALVLNLCMPEVDGFGVMQHLRRDPRLSRLPVLVATALPNRRDEIRRAAPGACEVLLMPFKRRDFLACLEELLNPHRFDRLPASSQ